MQGNKGEWDSSVSYEVGDAVLMNDELSVVTESGLGFIPSVINTGTNVTWGDYKHTLTVGDTELTEDDVKDLLNVIKILKLKPEFSAAFI